MTQPGPRPLRRARRLPAALAGVVGMLAGLLTVVGGQAARAPEAAAHPGHGGYSILVFSKTAAFRHDSIPAGIAAIQQLAAEHEFSVTATEDAAAFTDENLAQYDAVVWLSTTGDVLNDEQQAAFERYIQAGGGYAGIHAASDTEYDWPWYGELVGAYFKGHPRNQDATIQVADRTHPSTAHLPAQWQRFDEWYSFRTNPRGDVHVLASLDEGTYDPEANPMGLDHPIAWCHTYDGGRAWYTAGGHTIESYAEPAFLQHLLGGIETVAGVTAADCGGTVWDTFDKVPLDTGTANPMELDVAADGRVFYIERAGEVRMIDPATSQTTVVGTLDVYTQREDGLLGIALDPDFVTNGWIYLYYSPDGTEAEQRLSRLTLTGTTLDLASEMQLLEVPVDRAVSGHAGGSLSFDASGNLYLATGDDTNPFESDGYAPIDERPGRASYDAQRSSANTNDLRGKVLRIHPEPDGTYTIPDGNLFAPGTAQTRPEIYAMGFRNPFRIEVDGATGTLLVGDYGPDAPQADPDRGTEGQVEWNRITAAGNYGWPYCHGAGPFRDWDFATQTAGPPFDCANPVNDSPNNTGLTQLPPVTAPDVYYGRSETGTNWPEMGTGGGAMAGPVYRYDEALDSDVKWPAYYDGAALFYEWTNTEDGYVRPFGNDVWEFRLDEAGAGGIHDINPLLSSMQFLRPMDMTFGPDGALYLIEWGTGFGGNNADSGVYRIEYAGSGTRPVAQAAADPTSGALPLTVQFSSEGSGHPSGLPVTYHWAFGDGAESTDPNPTHTYTVAGQYSARLTVTAEDGATRSQTVQITAGNTAPEVTLDPPLDGGFFDFGDDLAYGIDVTDAEDGSTADGTIACDGVELQVLFGHAGHAHPVEVLPGCEGTVATSTDAGHPAGEDLFWVLEARYTDRGGDGVGSLTGRDLHVLQPKLKEAEHYQSQSGVQLEATSDPRGGRQNIGFIDDGDHISFDPMNLSGIDGITYRFASGGSGGRIEVRAGAPDGPLVSDSGFIPPTGGWQSWTDVTVPIEDPGGTRELFFVFRHEPGSTGLFNLNYLKFRGKGVSVDARPEIWSVEATPPSGELPYEVTLSAEATDPEGRELTYTWDFGDGTTATGAQVTHTYELSGVYRPTVTVTDAAGSVAHDSVRVEAVPEASPPIECADPGSDPPPDDEFDGDRLDGCRWDAVVRPDLNRFRVEGGQLKIDTTPTNLFDQHNNAPNLMLQTMPAGDWVVETKVSGPVCERWQQGGLLVYESDQTFLKLDYVGTSPVGEPCARKIEMRHEIDDIFQPAFPEVTLPDGVTTWWLRLEKTGSTYTGYYSSDGVDFQQVGVIENDRLATADVGVYAFGQEQTQATTVAFDHFHVLESEPPDACPDSDESPTVVIRDVDSGVTNDEREDGCTVEDLIEDEIEWPSQGRFMLHVRSVTQHLVHDGVLTRAERDAIIAAAGRSAPGGR
ncbi:PKD domain-containing protein [Jiangella aurantiaca]|uniref:PKD domain-containing protein n=1 Tax=Jiangella aurantiaca TaxID=2530373 RepID=A0A4R5AFN3_9ACTN|nr:ThuA domain-containing protein [Jiangella aurantiaca]TDD70029.1 PKD domain-containing protein [Jiangella aurantiaca]